MSEIPVKRHCDLIICIGILCSTPAEVIALTVGDTGTGTVTQNGGTVGTDVLILGAQPGSSGTYVLTGGQLTVNGAMTVGASGTGTFTQSGGTATAGSVSLGQQTGSNGSYALSGGALTVNDTVQVGTSGSGTLDISGGQLTTLNISVGENGYLTVSEGNQIIVPGNFENQSARSTDWNTSKAALIFDDGTAAAGSHQMALPGADRGSSKEAFNNNFAWDSVALGNGDRLTLVDGNKTPGAALYTKNLRLGDVGQIKNVSSDYNVYYDPKSPDNAYLGNRVLQFSGSGQLIPQGFTFLPPNPPDAGLTPNDVSFTEALDQSCNAQPTGNLAARCAELRLLSGSQRNTALNSLTPNQVPSQTIIPIKFNDARLKVPRQRLEALRAGGTLPFTLSLNGKTIKGGAAGDEPFRDSPLGLFLQSNFDFGEQATNQDSFGFRLETRAVTAGADYRFSDQLVAGLALDYMNTSTNYRQSAGHMESNSLMGATYGSYYLPMDFYVDWLGTYGSHDYQLTRKFAYPGFSGSATSTPNAYHYGLALGGGKDIAAEQWLISPYTRFEYINLRVESYQEKGGAGFATTVGGQTNESFISTLGTKISYNWSLPWGVLTPSIRFEWEHQFLNDNTAIPGRITAAPSGVGAFVIQTGKPDRDYVNLGGSLVATLPGGGTAFLAYESRLGQTDISNHAVSLGIRMSF